MVQDFVFDEVMPQHSISVAALAVPNVEPAFAGVLDGSERAYLRHGEQRTRHPAGDQADFRLAGVQLRARGMLVDAVRVLVGHDQISRYWTQASENISLACRRLSAQRPSKSDGGGMEKTVRIPAWMMTAAQCAQGG